jgi:hypothetical protein
MNLDSRDDWNNYSLGGIKRQLRALSAAKPPSELKERLWAGVPVQAAKERVQRRPRWWSGATGWVGIAAAIVVLYGVLWLRPPAGPAARPSLDVNRNSNRILAADYNSVRPTDINALDSNGLN